MINDVSFMSVLKWWNVHVLMICKHDAKWLIMMLCAFAYVLNELNFCHVFIIIACVSFELLMMFEKLCWLVKMLKSRVHAFAYYETVELLLKDTVEHLLKATVKHINAYIWYHMHDVKMLRVTFSWVKLLT